MFDIYWLSAEAAAVPPSKANTRSNVHLGVRAEGGRSTSVGSVMSQRRGNSAIELFEVHLEKQHYFAGEVVRGCVRLKTSQPISCRCVKFRIAGEGFSFWWAMTRDSQPSENILKYEQISCFQYYYKDSHPLGTGNGRTHSTGSPSVNWMVTQ